MQAFMNLKRTRKAEIARHPFFHWLRDSSIPVEQKFEFAPIMAVFVMNFRDMNLWVLRYQDADTEFHDILNGNTLEDETHSVLYLEDWQKLGLDDRLGWRTSDVLWWLFGAEATEPFRRCGVDFVRLCIDDGSDPLLRFSHSEAGEACGHVFFETIVPVTETLSEATGLRYRYFGQHHLDREKGHVIESEGVFENERLDPAQRAQTLALGDRMFDNFVTIFDAFHDYVERHVSGTVISKLSPQSGFQYRPPEPGVRYRPVLGQPAVGHEQVLERLEERKRRTAAHPFYAWLRWNRDVDAASKLRRFVPLWAMDIMGYRDLNRYVFHYPEPANRQECALNNWADTLTTHSRLFLDDWRALGLDDALGWNASEALRFLFLDPAMDVHRRNIVRFMQLGLRHSEPVLRFWLMHALEASGEAFFHNTQAIACAAERELDARLDYLADRHALAESDFGSDATSTVIEVPFTSEPLSESAVTIAVRMVDTVFDAVDEQLSLSLTATVTDRIGK